MRAIPILFCFDIHYASYAAVATFSAYANSTSDLKFYWVTTHNVSDLAERLKSKLEMRGIDITLVFIDVSKTIGSWREQYHLTSAAYLRLLAHEHINEEKLVYLDCDTLTLTDLRALYDTDLSNHDFAGVQSIAPPPKAVCVDAYINSGVLLMNLAALRKIDFFEKISRLYEKYEQQLNGADQDLINKFAEENKLLLEPTWNCEIFSTRTNGSSFLQMARSNSILHFVGPTKPWQAWCNPVISEFWWKYAKLTEIAEIQETRISKVGHLIDLANAEHINSNYQRASSLKSQALSKLVSIMTANQKNNK